MSDDEPNADDDYESRNPQPEPDLMYSEITVGRLLRKLNMQCVRAHDSGDDGTAKTYAKMAKAVHLAMYVMEFTSEEPQQ